MHQGEKSGTISFHENQWIFLSQYILVSAVHLIIIDEGKGKLASNVTKDVNNVNNFCDILVIGNVGEL